MRREIQYEICTVEDEECFKISTQRENVFFYVSKEDIEKVLKYRWTVITLKKKQVTYDIMTSGTCNNKEGYNLLTRYLLSVRDKNLHVDHKNHNTLDNRRSNLRICTLSENMRSRRKYNRKEVISGDRSKYKGVRIDGIYISAVIRVNGRRIHLGTFPTEKLAALAYNEAAKKYHGEFAVLNKID